jgi:amidase
VAGGDEPLWARSACAVVDMLRRREVSPLEVFDAALERLDATEGLVNAVPLRDVERARATARHWPTRHGAHAPAARLHGLPVIVKDLTDVAGLPTTLGDPALAQSVAVRSDAVVTRLQAAGAIVIGKSNVPFLGLGSDTANPLHGLTRNPWGLTHSTGGSSGGAAAAVACGSAWLAHGTDLGGSIRGPASHCGIAGLRPTPGRVGHGGPGTRRKPLDLMLVDGPMARDVLDLALGLDAMAGDNVGDPIALPCPHASFVEAAQAARLPERMAVSATLGTTPLHADVQAVFDRAVDALVRAGVQVEDLHPDFSGVADAAYDLRLGVTRARTTAAELDRIGPLLPDIARRMHADARELTLDRLLAAQERQQRLVTEMAAFFERWPLLLTAATAVPCALHHAGRLVDTPPRGRHWADDALHLYGVTLSHCPAVVIPAGRCSAGLPIGLQLVGPLRAEAALLAAAHALQQLLAQWAPRAPIEPRERPTPA